MSEEKKGFFKRLVSGLTKTRDNIVAGFDSIFSGYSSIDEDFYEELEEILIMGDIGINATSSIIEHLKEQVSAQHIKNPMECKQLLINSIKEQMRVDSTEYEFENRKSVILVIGVNGVGKTTSVGKLAGKLKDQGKKVILAAADTFRAAAGEQLAQWASRAGVDLIGGQEGADPASIVYDLSLIHIYKILEISHGKLYSYEAKYSKFLELKAQREEMEMASERKKQSILRMEIEWAKRGCRARSTKQRARLDRLEEMKNSSAPVRDSNVAIDSVETRMGKKTIELHHIAVYKRQAEHPLERSLPGFAIPCVTGP